MVNIVSLAGVEVKFKNMVYPILIQPNQIPELISVSSNSIGLKVGAAVTLNDMEHALKIEIESQPGKNMLSLTCRQFNEVDP
jgi:xanthine dehydrogenase/oxidase